MSTRGKELFTDGKLSALISRREQELTERIDKVSRQELEEATMEELCEEIEKELWLEPPALREDQKRQATESVQVKSHDVGDILVKGGEKTREGLEHRIDIPFHGEAQLFFCEPSIGASRSSPPALIEDDCLSLFYLTDPGNEEGLQAELEKDLVTIKKCLKRVKREVAEYNQSIKETCLSRLKARRAVVTGEKPARPSPAPTPEPGAPSPPLSPDLKFGLVTFTPGTDGDFAEDQDSGPERAPAPGETPPAPEKPQPPPRFKTGEPITCYIVDLDLFSYSDISFHLEQSLGARAIQVLNRQIQDFVARALKQVGLKTEHLPIARTGDGAIVAFDSVDSAARFAEAIHHVADAHNRGKTGKISRRHFRVGVSKGEIILEKELTPGGEVKGFSMSGTAIAKAVRLEAACETGEVLICDRTFADLAEDMRSLFKEEETVRGKREEEFPARRRKVVEPASED